MKKILSLIFILSLVSINISAQSTSDEKVLQIILEEREKGTSNARIVTKLMQQGVNIEQIRRVRRKAERMQKEEALGASDYSLFDGQDTDNRLRTGKNSKNSKNSKIKDESTLKRESESDYLLELNDDKRRRTRNVTDNTNQDWLDAQDEINEIIPDNPNKAYDIIRGIADDGKFYDVKEYYKILNLLKNMNPPVKIEKENGITSS